MTGSWDKTLKYWDLRQKKCVINVDLPERVYTCSVVGDLAVVGCANREIVVYDLKNASVPYKVQCSEVLINAT